MEVRCAETGVYGTETTRQVRPLGISYMDRSTVLIAWCLLRRDFRVFRLDRMRDLQVSGESFRPRRVALLRAAQQKFRAQQEASAKGRER